MPKLVEVIVTSVEEGVEAQLGGADRLELARALEQGGLTPSADTARELVRAVSIPVRVMLRENASMSLGSGTEMDQLTTQARRFAEIPIEGLVLGFVRNGTLDLETTQKILAAAPTCRATFHRAFEYAQDPLRAIDDLKRIAQVDRILTIGGEGSCADRRKRLVKWQNAAAPEIKILVGVGLCASFLASVKGDSMIIGDSRRTRRAGAANVCGHCLPR